jgi:hypothetical protein
LNEAGKPFGHPGDFMRYDPIFNSNTYEITIRNLKVEVVNSGNNGEMVDFTYNTQPWVAYRDVIKEVMVKSGVSSIGASALEGIGITRVDIPATVTNIAANAFKGCNSLATMVVHYTDLTGITVAETAFAGITDWTAIHLIVPACAEEIYHSTAPWQQMTIERTGECETAIVKIPVESFTLSPNPTGGIVNINNPTGKVVEIYTVSGSLLFKTNASVIDLRKYAPGVYLIRKGDQVAKLIKQ